MKSNTFDIPTYRFYIVRHENGAYNITGISSYKDSIERGTYSTIPYEEVSGLTFKDLKDIGLKGEVFIACFCDFNSINKKRYRIPLFYAPHEICRELDDKVIDDVVIESLEQKYNAASTYEKRIYNCFFERHQDLSHEHTVERIKKLEKTNNNN